MITLGAHDLVIETDVDVYLDPDFDGDLLVVPVAGGPGPIGPPGSAFEYQQNVAQSVWEITHNLGRWIVDVSVYSLDYSIQWDGFTVQPMSEDAVRLLFDDAMTGHAVVL